MAAPSGATWKKTCSMHGDFRASSKKGPKIVQGTLRAVRRSFYSTSAKAFFIAAAVAARAASSSMAASA